jgi:hypothetical protein
MVRFKSSEPGLVGAVARCRVLCTRRNHVYVECLPWLDADGSKHATELVHESRIMSDFATHFPAHVTLDCLAVGDRVLRNEYVDGVFDDMSWVARVVRVGKNPAGQTVVGVVRAWGASPPDPPRLR